MPIYIYRCESCGVQFERHQSFTDEPLKRCPECSKNSLRKVLTPAGIVFKGSGWYVTGGPRPANESTKFLLMWPGLDRCATIGFRCVKDME